MKRFLIIPLLLIAAAFSGQAQENGDGVNEKFFEAKIREFVYQLELTDAQKAAFVPVYKKYDEEMKATMGKIERPGKKAETSEDAAARVKAQIERQQKAQSVRLKYVDEFATVLEPRQLMWLFRVETDIQNKLKARQGHPNGQPGHFQGGPGQPGKGGQFQGKPGKGDWQGHPGQGKPAAPPKEVQE